MNNFYFSGEIGKELLYLRQFSLNNTFPLIGMPTSHEWLSYGPFYYWIMMPLFKITGGNPLIIPWVGLFVSIVGLVLGYWVMKKIVGTKFSVIYSLLLLSSPIFIWQTWLSKLHSFFFILIPIITYLYFLVWNGSKKAVFWLGIVFGLTFSFHFSQIPLFGVIVLMLVIRKYKPTDFLKFTLGLVIPNITIILHNIKIFLWVPYRILAQDNKSVIDTFRSLQEYFGLNLFWNQRLWSLGLIITAALFIHLTIKNKNNFKKNFLHFYIISSILFVTIANILHGTPPIHYFLPLFTTLPILFAIYISRTKFWPVVILLLFVINLKGYMSIPKPDDYIAYHRQVLTVDSILKDARGTEFSIKRIGPYDYFPEDYSQNYKYLLLWKGARLVEGSGNVYTINDYTNSYSKER